MHNNARLTPLGRERMVLAVRCEAEGPAALLDRLWRPH